MKITADTNVLLRAILLDDEHQAKTAQDLLKRAEIVAVTIPALCEMVWVLSRAYKKPASAIAQLMRSLMSVDNVVADRAAVEAGLAQLETGGDFADGVISYEGRWLGADTFVSFDKKAVELAKQHGGNARLL